MGREHYHPTIVQLHLPALTFVRGRTKENIAGWIGAQDITDLTYLDCGIRQGWQHCEVRSRQHRGLGHLAKGNTATQVLVVRCDNGAARRRRLLSAEQWIPEACELP